MTPHDESIYRAELVLLDGEFHSDTAVVVRNGRIEEVLRGEDAQQNLDSRDRIVDLGDAALLPGMVNVHSHAFQRGLRGTTEYRRTTDDTDDFWTWRNRMYRLANTVDPDQVETIATMAFMEMARVGVTRVGEFHYLHHRPDGTPYDDPWEMAERIRRAADEAGIRLTMLPAAYHTGGIGEPAEPHQRRFVHRDVDVFLDRVDALVDRWDDKPHVDVGLAPHSIRAVPRGWMEAIGDFADRRSLPVHIHVCEQPAEVEASREAFGNPPVEVLLRWGVLDSSWTLIHGTHLWEGELDILEDIEPTVGACPTTERNLGDGFLPAVALLEHGVPIALGSDSHTIIDHFDEMRCVEYHSRLKTRSRNVLAGSDPQGRTDTARILWPMATEHGARSLGADGGSIEPGAPADLMAVDLSHPSIAGADADTLLTDITLSMSPDAVRDVMVDGEPIVAEHRHRDQRAIVDEYRALMRQLAPRP